MLLTADDDGERYQKQVYKLFNERWSLIMNQFLKSTDHETLKSYKKDMLQQIIR